jgi:hypothetical protein
MAAVTQQQASRVLRIAYCLVLVAAMVPVGMAESGWIGAVIGGTGLGIVPSFGPTVFIALALYRITLVARHWQILAAPRAAGWFPRAMRMCGVALIHQGALAALVTWLALPLLKWFVPERTESGIEFYTELFLYLGAGLGMLGLALFEFSRLLAFEREAMAQ